MASPLERTLAQLLDKFSAKLWAVFGDELVSLVLYGSHARGTATPDSDIDLLVVVEDATRDPLGRIVKIKTDLEATTVSCLSLTRREARQFHWVYLDMIDEAVLLHDKGNFLKDRLHDLHGRLKELGSRKIVLPDGSWYWNLKPDLRPGERFEL